MVKSKITKIAEVMQKAETFALQEIDGNADDQLLVAAGLAAVTRNLYINALGPEEAQKVFEVMLDSFIVADEIIDGSYSDGYQKPTIHQEVNMKLLTDLWAHLKEWSDWGMKDWIKAGIVAIVVILVLQSIL